MLFTLLNSFIVKAGVQYEEGWHLVLHVNRAYLIKQDQGLNVSSTFVQGFSPYYY